MKKRTILIAIFSIAITAIFSTTITFAMPVKIVPAEAIPGNYFTIIDTPEGRLTDGTVAVFKSN